MIYMYRRVLSDNKARQWVLIRLDINTTTNDLLDGSTAIGDIRSAVPEEGQKLDQAQDQAKDRRFDEEGHDEGNDNQGQVHDRRDHSHGCKHSLELLARSNQKGCAEKRDQVPEGEKDSKERQLGCRQCQGGLFKEIIGR
jgi:hypothetical protein